MRFNQPKAKLKTVVTAAAALLLGAGVAVAQQQVNLTAGATSIVLPDGSSVPMWGYSCGAAVGGSTATCAATNHAAAGWSPVVITVPTGQDLQINLTNNLSFANGNTAPTSLMIVGQVGGGLGDASKRTTAPSPTHADLGVTWPTANTGATFTPPVQGPRVQSFGTEVAAGASAHLVWKAPRAGTYLLESGTHPSIQATMGLIGAVVVTSAPTATAGTETAAGQAYPSVKYDADVPLVLSEIDPVQNKAVSAAINTAGFSETAVWSGQPNGCGNPSSSSYNTCYPPVVNYKPLYYLINGVAFSKAGASASLFPANPTTLVPASGPGTVLVRFVNAGSHMHVPSIVASQTGAASVGGFTLVAEDGNPLPGNPRVQSEVFMAAGKTYDVMINAPPAGGSALGVYDRELSLSGNAINRDSGMLAYLSINGAALPAAASIAAAKAMPDFYNSVVPGVTLNVSDTSKGVLANDSNVFGVQVVTAPTKGLLNLATNGTFTYVPNAGWTGSDTFVYCGNGAASGPACATVTLGAAPIESAGGIQVSNITYTSNVATSLKIHSPGVLSVDKDLAGYPLTVLASSVTPSGGLTLNIDKNGGFNASVASAGTYSFTYKAQNSQLTQSATATVTLIFPQGSGLSVNVVDGQKQSTVISDYRWIIEEDRTFWVDPTKTQNNGGTSIVPTYGVNFHASDMPYVAQGCTGPKSCEAGQTVLGTSAVCDIAGGVCRTDSTAVSGQIPVLPSEVVLDPTKRYYISVLPGDSADPFYLPAGTIGHGMGGAAIAYGQTSVTVLSEPAPYQPSKLSIFVFEDDFPLNGEQDAGGGVDVLAPNEPGLGGFNIQLWDAMGGNGDFTGQMTYDMFNQPLSNSLDGTIDPISGLNACPISKQTTTDPTQAGITGMIVTCPKYESDGVSLSPLAGQAVVANLMPGRFGVVATPAADRIARGEEWHQTNTLDGQKAHDSFMRIGEPAYFQEFGPAGYHVTIGFANPGIINARLAGVCNGSDINIQATGPCNNSVKGHISTERMSRTPDERLYGSGDWSSFYFTQCYVSLGDPDGEDFAFTKCDAKGNFSFSNLPPGDWRVTVFDKWNDLLVDGLSTPALLANGATVDLGEIAMNQWQANVYTRAFIDDNKNGVADPGEAGIALINTTVRYRDGSMANNLVTDFTGTANFNETFPLFNWYVVETDTTRYKNTGTHTVYDAGGPADGTAACGQTGYPPCGGSTIGKYLANTWEQNPLPANLSVPGAVYCATADCSGASIQNGPSPSSTTLHSTGRIDTPWVGGVEGWQGYSGQNNFIEFGKELYAAGENGGIKGHVVYASTRPFDDPQMLVQTQWEPLVPHVTINLYQEGTAPDGSQSLTLVDTTQTSSWDDYAQGFRADGVTPNMNCPGQSTADLFYFSLYNQPDYLDVYNNQHNGTPLHTVPYNSQFKCYDGMHNWNQLQPAPYDGMYQFPSVIASDPTTGKPTATSCTICSPNTAVPSTDLYYGLPMLPVGKYVVEVVPPAGYELVKEEDKNILIGDNFIAPVTQEFGAMGNIFILPDQAQVASGYNANNAQNPTNSLGASPNNGLVPGFAPDPTWPCVGASRTVPDYISLYPQSKQVAPFAGATRNLCDRKEVTLDDQAGAIAKFYIYTSTHKASKFTGVITDDFTSEFDPFSPQFGEKFSPPDLPVSIRDWTGAETNRVYADHWGIYDGMSYSTWEVNPPNPTGYSPTMMVTCMNDRGDGATADPLFNSGYSQFCYELPYMPGQTGYFDTPVVPTSAFSAGYNHPDCAYPDATPAILEADGDGVKGQGPWVSAPGHSLTITGLGDQSVNNYAYSGPQASTIPFNQKTINRHYGFGSQCSTPTAGSATCNTLSAVTIGGITAKITSWNDASITVTVPTGVPACAVQQQAIYGGVTSNCGQLVITAGNGKQSVDSVTVTIENKKPTYVTGNAPLTPTGSGAIQTAIDAAKPGDMIMIPAGTYYEMLLMWKPVRLQGVGAASTVIDAKTQPAGKLDPWRHQVVCMFGLALNGTPINTTINPATNGQTNPYDPSGALSCGSTNGVAWGGFNAQDQNPQVDRLPLEGIVGWDTTTNGNLAQLLQEPTLLGAYEGAGITVLSKGVNTHGLTGYYGSGAEAAFPTGTTVLTSSDCLVRGANPFPSNFQCNPSSIDGLTITDASQGGGGIFAHAWAHNLQIANNRVYGNIGTLSGGINIGQGESPDIYSAGTAADSDPGSCRNDPRDPTGLELPYCFDMHVNVHNNAVMLNTSIGDELFSGTPAGAGGVTFCTGADYYKFNYNWICGNQSTGDGGGVAHLGFIWDGDIEHNTIIFNQSTNPTISTNGGGLIVMGAAPDGFTAGGIECGSTAADADCAPGLPDGTGPGLVINANLIMGNAAESGSGGGLRFQSVNGTEIATFPGKPAQWNSITVTNNIIANNVAGWDGAGVSLQDSLAVDLINNTIVSNDTTATAGVLFNTLGAPLASAPGATNQTTSTTTSAPQPAGLVTMPNSANLTASFAGLHITCPANHPHCTSISFPYLANDLFWENRTYYIGVGALSPQYQQNIVTLYQSFTTNPEASQPAADAFSANGNGSIITGGTGACTTASYWDIGVRGDKGPGDHSSLFILAPTYSVLTSSLENGAGTNVLNKNPTVVNQYCNGSRTPPEFGGSGYQVPPGISDATVPNPIFNLSPSATVDEGNNWVNISWGPLTMVHPITGATLGNYALAANSPAIDYVPTSGGTYSTTNWPTQQFDFFGNKRLDAAVTNKFDVGAVEYQGNTLPPTLTAIAPTTGVRGTTVAVTLTGTNLLGTQSVGVSGSGVTVSSFTAVSATTVSANFVISPGAALTARSVTVTTAGGTSNGETFTITGPSLASIAPTSGARGSVVPVTLTGVGLTGSTAITVSGGGITVGGLSVVNSTTVNATFTISASASLTARTVSITTPIGVTNTVPFTVVLPATPTLTSIAPNSGYRGTSVPVTLTGTGFTATGTTVAITAPAGGVTITGVTVVNSTTIHATITSSGTATLGARSFRVTTLGGTSNAATFTVIGAALTSISPATGARGTASLVTLTGSGLTGTTAITVSSTGVSVSGITVVNDTTVTATFTVAANATLGASTVTVTAPGGASNTVAFTVQGPAITSIVPAAGLHNTSASVTIHGSDLAGATGVTMSGSGITCSVTGSTSTAVNANCAIANTATHGSRNVSVATPNGNTNTLNGAFTVQ
jgi:hypothetical protein